MGNLSSRELAAVIWGTILLIYVITKKETRSSFYNVIKIFFGKKLRVIWIVYFLYVLGITFLFSLLSFWKIIFMKDVIFWVMFYGLIYYMNAVSKEADETYIKNIIRDNFKLIIIFEFVISTFTFNIFIELLIMPIFTIISIMSFISEWDIKYQNVHKLVNYIAILLGFVFVYKTLEIGINEYKYLNALDTLISFLIPIIYLFLTLPLIYIINLYSKYDLLFLKMSFKEGEDKKINKRRRFRVLKICNISIRKVIIFKNKYLPRLYKKMSEEEFNNLLSEFKQKSLK